MSGWYQKGGWVGKNYYLSTKNDIDQKPLPTSIAIEIGPAITKINGRVHHGAGRGRAAESLAARPPLAPLFRDTSPGCSLSH